MSGRRPPTGMRPPTGSRAPPQRLPTGMVPGTGRPGSRAGGLAATGALGAQIKVADRPVTQQGLGGMKTGAKGPGRQVQDKSYFLGMLRSKNQDLGSEVLRMTREIENYNQDNATYLTFEKKAEALAGEIKVLQGEMADYNTLMDKVNTDTETPAVLMEFSALQRQNDSEARSIDSVFANKQQAQDEIARLEALIEEQKMAAERLVDNMDPDSAQRYRQLQEEGKGVGKELTEQQNTLETLMEKIDALQEELGSSEIKQEAYRLYQQLSEVEQRRDEWREKDKETPQKERERLLEQVKADNQEIASMEKRNSELGDKIVLLQDQLRQADNDLEEANSHRAAKFRDLRKREETITKFVDSFEETKAKEEEQVRTAQENIVTTLEHISESMLESQVLPSVDQFEEMQADLQFKKDEREKSEATAKTLEAENAKLKSDLAKVENLEGKITAELEALKADITAMTQDIVVFSDLQGLQIAEEERRIKLAEEKEQLLSEKETAKLKTQEITRDYEEAKAQLEENETYIQLGNLEKKWQHHEQNNFVMKEFIASRQTEGNYKEVVGEVNKLMADYNSLLCQSMSGVTAQPA